VLWSTLSNPPLQLTAAGSRYATAGLGMWRGSITGGRSLAAIRSAAVELCCMDTV
jgi:hypothetical protein